MGVIKKSVKQMILVYLKEKGQSTLKDITNYILSERTEIKSSHVRGVLNEDIRKGSKFFTRNSRGIYSLSNNISTEEVVNKEIIREEIVRWNKEDIISNEEKECLLDMHSKE